MAIARITHDGYATLEMNRAEYSNMESQCSLDGTVFPSGAEMGSLVNVDKTAGKIKLSGGIVGLLMNSERIYNQFKPGLKNYKVEKGDMASVLFLLNGFTFTTNNVSFDSTDYAAETDLDTALAAVGTTPIYGKKHTDGSILLTPVATGAPLAVVKKTTMPDGQKGIKFIVIGSELF